MPGADDTRLVIAVDPGTHKCGIALLRGPGEILVREVAGRDAAITRVAELLGGNPGAAVVIGNSTQGPALVRDLALQTAIQAELVDETNSTMDARALYWQENRPGCLWAIFPPSFRPMPRPIDDYAAVIIARRYLASRGANDV